MPKMIFTLSISPEQYRRYYRGTANSVVVRSENGRTVRFPASELRKFVSHTGVHGRFQIEFDVNNKLLSLVRFE